MRIHVAFLMLVTAAIFGCETEQRSVPASDTAGLSIAFINGDSVLRGFNDFRAAAEQIDKKQAEAEQMIQEKAEGIDRQISAYQKKAQSGTMTPKQMQAEERRLGELQQSLRAESDEISQSLIQETSAINDKLQKVVKAKLKEIKDKEGYDFIFNSADGGPILVADPKHDITDRVVKELNAESVSGNK